MMSLKLSKTSTTTASNYKIYISSRSIFCCFFFYFNSNIHTLCRILLKYFQYIKPDHTINNIFSDTLLNTRRSPSNLHSHLTSSRLQKCQLTKTSCLVINPDVKFINILSPKLFLCYLTRTQKAGILP